MKQILILAVALLSACAPSPCTKVADVDGRAAHLTTGLCHDRLGYAEGSTKFKGCYEKNYATFRAQAQADHHQCAQAVHHALAPPPQYNYQPNFSPVYK